MLDIRLLPVLMVFWYIVYCFGRISETSKEYLGPVIENIINLGFLIADTS